MAAAQPLGSSALGAAADTYFYELSLAPGLAASSSSLSLSAVIGSDDVVRLFDAGRLSAVHQIAQCHQGVTCLDTLVGDTFVTAGRDGRIRCWDQRAQRTGVELIEPRSAGFSALACRESYIAAGTESTKEGLGDVAVLLYDARSPSQPVRQYTESHTDTVTQLKFHPSQASILLSGSTDGLVSVFDTTHADEDDALKQVLNPRSAVHCAGFLTADSVYVLSSDEQFWIYGLDTTGAAEDEALPVLEAGDVRQKLECMYVIDLIQTGDAPPVLAYGHNEHQTLSLAPLSSLSWAFGSPVSLSGAHGDEVVRDIGLLGNTAISCGEDGHVRAWRIDGGSEAGGTSEQSQPKISKRDARKAKKSEDRFAPY